MDHNKRPFVFENVKPECVDGKFFNAKFDKSSGTLTINQYGQEKHRKLFCEKLLQTFEIKLSPCLEGPFRQLIGRIVCIGCQQNIVMLQFITSSDRYINFVIADLTTGDFQVFRDTAEYFNRDFHAFAPLECLMDLSSQTVLLRLPQGLLKSRSWCKAIMVQFKKQNEDSQISPSFSLRDITATGTKQCSVRDRRFNCMAFHPKQEHTLITLLVNDYCDRLKASLYDVVSGETKVAMEICYREQAGSGLILRQTNLTVSKTGDTVCACCLATRQGDDGRQPNLLKMMLLDSETLQKVATHTIPVDGIAVTPTVAQTSLFSPIHSRCGSRINVWHLQREKKPHFLGRIKVEEHFTLRRLCRVLIVQHVNTADVDSLPLPTALKMYLKFEQK